MQIQIMFKTVRIRNVHEVMTVMTIIWDNTSIILKYNFDKNVFMGLERRTNEAYDTSNSSDTTDPNSSDTNDTDDTDGTNDTSDTDGTNDTDETYKIDALDSDVDSDHTETSDDDSDADVDFDFGTIIDIDTNTDADSDMNNLNDMSDRLDELDDAGNLGSSFGDPDNEHSAITLLFSLVSSNGFLECTLNLSSFSLLLAWLFSVARNDIYSFYWFERQNFHLLLFQSTVWGLILLLNLLFLLFCTIFHR